MRAHSLAGVFVNTAGAKVTEGSHRSVAVAIKERHRLEFSKKQSKPRYEEVMREGHMATLSAMFTRTKKDREALPDMVEILMYTHMHALYEKWVAPDPQDVGILAHMLRMALCQEALLRFDELANITFGDILITDTCLHIFIFESKTDKVRKGQWVQVYKDRAPWKAYTLHVRRCIAETMGNDVR